MPSEKSPMENKILKTKIDVFSIALAWRGEFAKLLLRRRMFFKT
jgi:hypothetical protein